MPTATVVFPKELTLGATGQAGREGSHSLSLRIAGYLLVPGGSATARPTSNHSWPGPVL